MESLLQDYLFKIIVVGEPATGIIKRYVHNIYTGTYKSTIGVDFALKTLQWNASTSVQLQMWDIAGQERFGNMTRVFYKDANACLIVYDVSNPRTFEIITKWKLDVDNKVLLPDGKPVPCYLLANKIDLKGLNKTEEELNAYCKEHGFEGWFATSVPNNTNIEKVMNTVVEKILEDQSNLQKYQAKHSGVVKVSSVETSIQTKTNNSSTCCAGKAIRSSNVSIK